MCRNKDLGIFRQLREKDLGIFRQLWEKDLGIFLHFQEKDLGIFVFLCIFAPKLQYIIVIIYGV